MVSVHEVPALRSVEGGNRNSEDIDDAWEKRQALRIAVDLPQDADSAYRILEHVDKLVTDWWPPAKPAT